MQPEKIILLPATHESLPCFHVKEELLSSFLDHLRKSGITVPAPPQPQANPGTSVVKVEVDEGTPENRLEEILDDFLKKKKLE
jgi:hypothetical protein